MGTVADKLNKAMSTKADIKAALIAKGQTVSDTDTFASYANKVRAIQTGVNTGDATAAAADILSGKTAYVNGQKVTGTIPSLAAQIYRPGFGGYVLKKGQYLLGNQTIPGDSNLAPQNIKSGVSIFGVQGSLVASGIPFQNGYQFVPGRSTSTYIDHFNSGPYNGTVWFNGSFRFAWVKFYNGAQLYLTPMGGTRLGTSDNTPDGVEYSFRDLTGKDYVENDEDGWEWMLDPGNLMQRGDIIASLYIGDEI